MESTKEITDTNSPEYLNFLIQRQNIWWKKLLPVQAPYRGLIRALKLGKVLEIGCGLGRLMPAYQKDSVGIDHNAAFVRYCKSNGHRAYTTEEFLKVFSESGTFASEKFDTLVLAHVLEHCTQAESVALLRQYYPFLKKNARILLITPQEKGYASDPTHVQFADFKFCTKALSESGAKTLRQFSYPFPRAAGKLFIYNEFVTLGSLSSKH